MSKLQTKDTDIIAKEGYPFIVGGFASSILLYNKSKIASLLSFSFGAFSTYFFRNPKRVAPDMKNALISAADGVVISKGKAQERYFFKRELNRISVFMSLLDVHVNRSPIRGRVLDIVYNEGKYLPAYREKASMDNEQNALLIEDEYGRRIVVVQIAGLIARRIVCYKKPGDEVEKGEIIGLIRFGSRVDIYTENEFSEFVNVNEKVKAGETILGVLR
jgi:phosphatidylserine decarboxylase